MNAEKLYREPQKSCYTPSKQETFKWSIVDNRSQTVSQAQLIKSIQNKENKTDFSNHLKTNQGVNVIQLGKTYPGGKSTGRGGKGKKMLVPSKKVIRRPVPKMLVPTKKVTRRPAPKILPYIRKQKTAILSAINKSKHVFIDKRSEYQFQQVIAFFKSPSIAYASDFLLQFALTYKKKLPHSVKVVPLPEGDKKAGYYRRENTKNKSELCIHMGENREIQDIASTLIHEYTHVFDLEVLTSKDYRKTALQRLELVLNSLPEQTDKVREVRFRQMCGLLDSHSDTTTGLSIFLSELLASFSGLALLDDPMYTISNFFSTYKSKSETSDIYKNRIIDDYNTLMWVLVPYIKAIVGDETISSGIRNYFFISLLSLPTDGRVFYEKLVATKTMNARAMLLFVASQLCREEKE